MRECTTNWAPSDPCSLWNRWRRWRVHINDVLPSSFDGREEWGDLIHPIMDQGDCGSSWAFFYHKYGFPHYINMVTITMFWLRYLQIRHPVNPVGPCQIPVFNELIYSSRRGSRQIKFALKWETVRHVFSTKFNLMQQRIIYKKAVMVAIWTEPGGFSGKLG